MDVGRLPSEHEIQSSYLDWLERQHPKVYEMTIAIPNAGKRSFFYAKKLKREGMKKGFPDTATFWPAGEYHGLIIEFKSQKGKLQDEQKYFLDKLSAKGYCCHVARSLEEAMKIVNSYLNPVP